MVPTSMQVINLNSSSWNYFQDFFDYPLLRDHLLVARAAVIWMLARLDQSKTQGRINFC